MFVKRSTLRPLILLPQAHLLEISVLDICGVAWLRRGTGREGGDRVSGIEIVIAEASGIPSVLLSPNESVSRGVSKPQDSRD